MIKFQFNTLFLMFFSLFILSFLPSWDGVLLFFLLISLSMSFFKTKWIQMNWMLSLQLWLKLQIEMLILSKQSSGSSIFNFTLKSLFLFLIIMNLSGLNIFLNQNFMGKLSMSLLIMSLSFWLISYTPFLGKGKEKLSLFIIGEMKFPILSFLLSNIEILTHLFRPITLTARLWVNIWVGHLLMSVLSTFFLIMLYQLNSFFFGSLILLSGFFLFEMGIMCLQAFVFSYLIGVYWKENLEHSLIEWH